MLLEGALCSLHTQQVRHHLHSVFPLLARSTSSNRAAALQQARVHERQVVRCCAVCLQHLFTAHRGKVYLKLVFVLCRLLVMLHGGSEVAAGGTTLLYIAIGISFVAAWGAPTGRSPASAMPCPVCNAP